MTLREEVEKILPNWRSWYPSLFDAACDLGVLRARVCPPESLLLHGRHADVRNEAEQAYREKWGGAGAAPDEHPEHGRGSAAGRRPARRR